MKACVMAAAISVAELRAAPRPAGDRGRAERQRYSEADLAELLGDMSPSGAATPHETDDADFIRWAPDAAAA